MAESSAGTVIAGHFDQPDTYHMHRPTGRQDWLVAYTLAGRGYFVAAGCSCTCTAGDVVLLKPGVPHEYGTVRGERWNFVWAHFSPRLAEVRLLPDRELLVHPVDSEAARQRIHGAFRRVLAEFQERGALWHELCENALREILLLLAKRLRKPVDPRIEEALRLLADNVGEPIAVERLAKAVGLSASRLSHLFKETTGSSIVETLNRMRIRQAALLLRHTNRNASEVALEVGFPNYNHFLFQFRKQYGVSPRTFRADDAREP